MSTGLDIHNIHAQFGLVRKTSDLASSTGTTASSASTIVATAPGSGLLYVLRAVKFTASAAVGTARLSWGTVAGVVAWKAYNVANADDAILSYGGENQHLILHTADGIGNNFFDIYLTIQPATGTR